MLSGEIWLVLGAIAGGLMLARLWRSAEARVVRLQAETATLSEAGKRFGASLSKQTQARKRLSEELATLRNKADKSKRRQSKALDPPLGTAARIRDHEAEVKRVQFERDRADSEREGLARQLVRLEARLEAAERALEEATAPPPAVVADQTERALEELQAELTASRERLTKQHDDLGIARQTEARIRKRMNNQDQLYASLRAELAVKKDRLRTQEEQLQRLQALQVAMMD